jgi:recombinational DNA repair ATPase RecF
MKSKECQSLKTKLAELEEQHREANLKIGQTSGLAQLQAMETLKNLQGEIEQTRQDLANARYAAIKKLCEEHEPQAKKLAAQTKKAVELLLQSAAKELDYYDELARCDAQEMERPMPMRLAPGLRRWMVYPADNLNNPLNEICTWYKTHWGF